MNKGVSFDWTVYRDRWRPSLRPKPPFGPTVVEVIRACALRRLFELSPGYERRMHFSGRIGTAFHKAIESLARTREEFSDRDTLVDEALHRFENYLDIERMEAASHPREREVPEDDKQVQRAREALIAESLNLFERKARIVTSLSEHPAETEIPVQSADGFFKGYVDRAEHGPSGTHIIDYKSASRADIPERYERQLQMYASMWCDSRGEWPARASLRYPLAGKSTEIVIDPKVCEEVMTEARAAIGDASSSTEVEALAKPGDVCQVCEFRPWCEPFWRHQQVESSKVGAFSAAHVGFEGTIEELSRTASLLAMSIAWRDVQIRVVVRPDRFPHLVSLNKGDVVRVLDFDVQGLVTQPKAIPKDQAEIFIVR